MTQIKFHHPDHPKIIFLGIQSTNQLLYIVSKIFLDRDQL